MYTEIGSYLGGEELKKRMQQAETKEPYRRWQCLYLSQGYEVRAGYLSDVSGLFISAVYLLVEGYNKQGPDSRVAYQARGGRRHACLSQEREEKLLEGLGAKAALGEILTVDDIRAEAEREVGFPVWDDYLWEA